MGLQAASAGSIKHTHEAQPREDLGLHMRTWERSGVGP
jgi:hypothetical protein